MSKKKKIIIKIRSKKKGEEKESRGCRMRRDVKGKKKERSGQITYNKDLCERKLWTQPWD